MLMADTMAIFLSVLGLLIACPALWLLCRGLWPDLVELSKADCSVTLFKPFLVGLPLLIAAVIAVIFLGKLPQPVGGISCLALICLFITYAGSGVAGLATVIGERLPSPVDAQCPWKATIRGGIVLELSYILPFLGWFVLLPVSIVIGAGATTRALIKNRKQKPTTRNKNGDLAISGDLSIPGDNQFGGTVSAPV
ncbi:MAG: hypothetical protein JST89_19800 [Cyanobacteria bacterium SZAS-4]|nr:hypothetical protein [Cyanobacteria bacterium SZAS-4]